MKNFSTVGARLFGAILISGAVALPALALTCEFKANAPEQHTVVRGDTLWDISGKFLDKPWCWPQVWGMNREEIANPHWIYPGQIIYLDRATGRLRLGKPQDGESSGASDFRLAPQLRTEGLGRDAVPSIPSGAIEPFLSQPLIIEEEELKGAPRIIGAHEGRVFIGKGDKAYVKGDLRGGTAFQVFRPGKPLKDPLSKQVVGQEAFYLGTLKLVRAAEAGSEVHTFTVSSAKEEMGKGDLLMQTPPAPMRNYVPHAPAVAVDAMVLAVYGGVTHAGQNQIVSINRGKLDGLELGSVLQLYHRGQSVDDPDASRGWLNLKRPQVRLPDEAVGSLFIFRVFKRISYGLIMQVTEPIVVGDVAKTPE